MYLTYFHILYINELAAGGMFIIKLAHSSPILAAFVEAIAFL